MRFRRTVIVGAAGDPTGRYLLPAVAALRQSGLLRKKCDITGVVHDDWTTERFCAPLGGTAGSPCENRRRTYKRGGDRETRDAAID